MESATILIADDHPLFRSGISQTVQNSGCKHNIIEAGDGNEALSALIDNKPDLAILDIRMPGFSGIEILEKLPDIKISTKVILLTMHKNPNYFYKAVSLGVKGYVLKDSAASEICEAVNMVLNGRTYISQQLKDLSTYTSKSADPKIIIGSINSLTPAERNVLKLISQWKSNEEIAGELNVSPRTIGNHRTHIAEKLNLNGIHGVIRYAIENKDLF